MTLIERGDAFLRVCVDASLYNESVVFKCFYWYASQYQVDIEHQHESSSFQISLRPKSGVWDEAHVGTLEQRIRQDLIDFKTRDIVGSETRAIRELLVAKAFASSDELDEEPPGSATDSVGFNPEDFGRGD